MSETGGTKGVGISDLLERSVAIVQAIDALRENEGAMVTICCDNPDYNGLPNCAIDVCDGWTDWEEESFRADTVLDCLQLALKSRTERVKRSNVELSDGRGGH